MKDEQAKLEKLTGRKVERADVQCSMCAGVGFDQFGECEVCEGKRYTREWVFECGHPVESEDCIDEGCLRCTTPECDNDRELTDDRCAECLTDAAYWKAQWDARPQEYTREEIESAYSDPTESAKREILLRRLG